MGEEAEFLRRFNTSLENLKQPYPIIYITNTRTHAREEKNNII